MQNKSSLIIKIILLVGLAISLTSLIIMLTMTPTTKMKDNQPKEIVVENHYTNVGGE